MQPTSIVIWIAILVASIVVKRSETRSHSFMRKSDLEPDNNQHKRMKMNLFPQDADIDDREYDYLDDLARDLHQKRAQTFAASSTNQGQSSSVNNGK
ncbi:hypothetical protein I4U23_022367 [Adineta vaga]|nr:hypothetical protein I4U23_022367 [Adineta vaga]